MKNPRYSNHNGGILIEQENGIDLYVDSGELYEVIKSGAYGVVAEYIAPVDPEPTIEQLQANKRAERDRILASVDIKINKSEDAGQDSSALRQYRIYLRDFPQQDGEWWISEITTFEDWGV